MTPENIRIEDFDYPLAAEKIATHPLAQRDACRLLVFNAATGTVRDERFSSLPELLPPHTMLVYNNTRVINARLKFTKSSGATIEIFCLEPECPADYERNFAARECCSWNCLVGNSKRWKEGPLTMSLEIEGSEVVLTATRPSASSTLVTFSWTGGFSFSEIILAAGQIPIPPYLNRQSEDSDSTDYQTVYAHIEGSVAAPTAGLHFTDELLKALDKSGVERREVTLHVGAGTFRPVKSDTIGEHDMHSEFITVRRSMIDDLIKHSGPVVAVGTTSVRTLESLYHIGCMILSGKWEDGGELPQWAPYESASDVEPRRALEAVAQWMDMHGQKIFTAYTRIIIAPGYTYRIVKGMITNFHQPKSTLLLLVSAFIGDTWRDLYAHALDADYRFLSYGDACLFLR